MIIEVLLVGLLPPAVPAVGEGERGEVPVEVETGVGLGLCWPAARAELPGTAATAGYIAPAPGGGTGPGSGLGLLAAPHGTLQAHRSMRYRCPLGTYSSYRIIAKTV